MNQNGADMSPLLSRQSLVFNVSDEAPVVSVAFSSTAAAQKRQPREATNRLTNSGKREMTTALEDQAAIDRVLAGDTAAFAVIVRHWQGPLVNLAYRFCRDRGRAEDMAQEAFLRAFRGLRSWRRDAAFSTWLFALATNVYRTEMRRSPPPSVPMDENVMTAVSVEDAVSEADRRTRVQRALHSLPSKYRDPLLLFYFHEQDIATTARSLDLPEGTVKARLSRGRALLNSKLGNRP
jgi:RNA polymerase sigma-70 factor, ECF subfamily